MAATADPFDERALPFRVATLERNEVSTADKLSRVDDRVDTHAELLAVHTTLLAGLREDVVALRTSVDKAVWGLVGLCVTIAGSAAALSHFLG